MLAFLSPGRSSVPWLSAFTSGCGLTFEPGNASLSNMTPKVWTKSGALGLLPNQAPPMRRPPETGGGGLPFGGRGRTFHRGNAAAVPKPAEDAGGAPFGWPSLVRRILERGDLILRQRIVLNRLQVCSLRRQAICGDGRSGNRTMRHSEQFRKPSRPVGEGDRRLSGCPMPSAGVPVRTADRGGSAFGMPRQRDRRCTETATRGHASSPRATQ